MSPLLFVKKQPGKVDDPSNIFFYFRRIKITKYRLMIASPSYFSYKKYQRYLKTRGNEKSMINGQRSSNLCTLLKEIFKGFSCLKYIQRKDFFAAREIFLNFFATKIYLPGSLLPTCGSKKETDTINLGISLLSSEYSSLIGQPGARDVPLTCYWSDLRISLLDSGFHARLFIICLAVVDTTLER